MFMFTAAAAPTKWLTEHLTEDNNKKNTCNRVTARGSPRDYKMPPKKKCREVVRL